MPAANDEAVVATVLRRGASGGLAPAELQALARRCHALLAWPESGDALVALLRELAAAVMREQPAARGLACRRGCSACCHQHVTAHAVELFAIARRLRGQRQVVPAAGRACAMLGASGECTVHADRPFACRMFVSTDALACARAFAAGEAPATWPRPIIDTMAWALMAVWAAQQARGLPVRAYAFVPALAAVLADPDLERRWFAGDDGLVAFAGAADLPHPAMLAAAQDLARAAGLV